MAPVIDIAVKFIRQQDFFVLSGKDYEACCKILDGLKYFCAPDLVKHLYGFRQGITLHHIF